ncbi:hypothetical protein [Phycicoccus avicenniae]|nr:hypothetical protein [Phycicoccus avicenniae]
MSTAAAVVFTVLMAALSVLQVLVAAGRPFGRLVWGGRHEVLPRRLRVGSAVSVVLYAAFSWLVLARSGVLPGGDAPGVGVGTWVLVAYLVLGVAVNGVSRSRPERLVRTPVVAVLAGCALVVALEV